MLYFLITKKGKQLLSKIQFRIYQLPTPINRFVDLYQKFVCKWNHCSIQVDDVVIHFFDDWQIARWSDATADTKLLKPVDVVLISTIDVDWKELREYCNSLKPMSTWDHIIRYVSPWTFFTIPKHNDCVHRCSLVLNKLYGWPICNGTPDHLYKMVKIYADKLS